MTNLTFEKAQEEFTKSEKGIRYQLIEGKILADNNLQIKAEELKNFSREMITKQMAQYGQPAPEGFKVEKN